MPTMKRLYRSKSNRVIFGVFGGLGEYSNTDPTILRLIFAVITVFSGFIPGLVAYLFAAIIVPERNIDNGGKS